MPAQTVELPGHDRGGLAGFVVVAHGPRRADPFLGDFLAGLGAGFAATPLDLLLVAVPEHGSELQRLQRLVETGRVDGIVLSRTEEADARVDWLAERRFPFVTYGSVDVARHPFCWLATDGGRAFGQAFDLLYDLGHRHFALVTIDEPMTFRRVRADGLAAAIAARGDPAVTLATCSSPRFDRPARAAAVRAMLTADHRPTAVICLFDELAFSVMDEAKRQGLEVPGDLSVIGFDDTVRAALVTPGLTTFDARIGECAAGLAELLTTMVLERPATPPHRLVQPTLVLRGSHGPAPGGAP